MHRHRLPRPRPRLWPQQHRQQLPRLLSFRWLLRHLQKKDFLAGSRGSLAARPPPQWRLPLQARQRPKRLPQRVAPHKMAHGEKADAPRLAKDEKAAVMAAASPVADGVAVLAEATNAMNQAMNVATNVVWSGPSVVTATTKPGTGKMPMAQAAVLNP